MISQLSNYRVQARNIYNFDRDGQILPQMYELISLLSVWKGAFSLKYLCINSGVLFCFISAQTLKHLFAILVQLSLFSETILLWVALDVFSFGLLWFFFELPVLILWPFL